MYSLKQGTLSESKIIGLKDKIQTDHLRDVFDPEHEFPSSNGGDMLYADSSTTTSKVQCGDFTLLFVEGDLTVTGSLAIDDDPPTFLIVTGDLTIEGSLLTAGWVEVQ